jgi:hypothetical protein
MGTISAQTLCTLGLSLLLPLTALAAPMPEAVLGRRVSEMFQVGFARTPRAFNEVQRLYDSLLHDDGENARIDYAHGLVLLRLMKNKEAQAEFLVATRRSGIPYWPAWEALIWSNFIARDYDAGYERLVEFSRLVQQSDEISEEARHDEIHWIGRVMAALELTLDSIQVRESWLQSEKKLTGLSGIDAIEIYNSGKQDVYIRHSLLEDDIRQTREKGKERQIAKLEKKQEQFEKTLDAAKSRRENLKRSAAEMKESLTEQTAVYEKQMARLERDYGFVERRAGMLTRSMTAIDQEIATLQFRKKNFQANSASNGRIDQMIAQLQNQRWIYEADFQRAAVAAQQISATAQALTEERTELVDRYQKLTGELIEVGAGVEKWKERTLKQVETLKKAEATVKQPATSGKIQLARSFRTYVDLDLFAERDRVLDSFGVTPANK